MIVQVGITTGGNIKKFQGLSTDLKPLTDLGGESMIYELDTKNVYIFDEVNINPITNNGWWEV